MVVVKHSGTFVMEKKTQTQMIFSAAVKLATALCMLLLILFFKTTLVKADTITWDGGGAADPNWSNCNNWFDTTTATNNVCPGAADTVVFNATSTNNSTVDATFGGSITAISINAGYTGTITLARSLAISSTYSQSAGFFTASDQSFSVTGSFTMNAGSDFTASSGTSTFSSTFNITGGSFHNNGGTVNIAGISSNVTCTGAAFNLVTINLNAGQSKTVGVTCNLPLGNNPTVTGALSLSGTLTGTGTLTITSTLTANATAVLSGFSGLSTQTFTISGGTVDLSGYTTFTSTGTVTLSSGSLSLPIGSDLNGSLIISNGTFTAPAGAMTIAGALTISGSPTFTATGSTITFDGNSSVLSCNGVTFNQVVLSPNAGQSKTVNSNCSLPLGASPTIGSTVLNGALRGSGTLTNNGGLTLNNGSSISDFSGILTTLNGGLTMNVGASVANFSGLELAAFTISGATVDLTGISPVNIHTSFSMSSGSFKAPAVMNISRHFTVSGGSFDANGGVIHFINENYLSSTLNCGNITFNLVTFDKTDTLTIMSNCIIPLGDNPTIVAPFLNLSGKLEGTGTLSLNGGQVTLNSSATLDGFSGLYTAPELLLVVGNTLDLSSYSTVDLNNGLTISGGTLTAPAGTMTLSGNFDNSGTFNSSNGTLILDGSNQTITGDNTFYNLTKTTPGSTLTFTANQTQTIQGILTLQGTANSPITLVSSTPGTQYLIDTQGGRAFEYLNITDMDNISSSIIDCPTCTDSGHNNYFFFHVPENHDNQPINTMGCGFAPLLGKTPWLYGILPKGPNALDLYITPADEPFDKYFIQYGPYPGVYLYGAEFGAFKDTRIIPITYLSPNTKYYFRIRAGNGCANGAWSNELFGKTPLKTSSSFAPILSKKTKNTTSSKSKPTPKPIIRTTQKSQSGFGAILNIPIK
jgi:hypothetical protein